MAKIDYILQDGKIFFSTESVFSLIEELRADTKITSDDPVLQAKVEAVAEKLFSRLELKVVKNATGALADYMKNPLSDLGHNELA